MILAPNWHVIVIFDAVNPRGVELAHLEFYAASESEAWSIARSFLAPSAKIISLEANRRHTNSFTPPAED